MARRLPAPSARHLLLGSCGWLAPSHVRHRHLLPGSTFPDPGRFLHDQSPRGGGARIRGYQSYQVCRSLDSLFGCELTLCVSCLTFSGIQQTDPLAPLVPNVRAWLCGLCLGIKPHRRLVPGNVNSLVLGSAPERVYGACAAHTAYLARPAARLRAAVFDGATITHDSNKRFPVGRRRDLEPLPYIGSGDLSSSQSIHHQGLGSVKPLIGEVTIGVSSIGKTYLYPIINHKLCSAYWNARGIGFDGPIPRYFYSGVCPGAPPQFPDLATSIRTSGFHGRGRCPRLLPVGLSGRIFHCDAGYDGGAAGCYARPGLTNELGQIGRDNGCHLLHCRSRDCLSCFELVKRRDLV